jgi:hypothetical protein
MKYVILPIWKVIRALLRGIYVLSFMGFVILKTLWDLKFDTETIRRFLDLLAHQPHSHIQYYQTPKSLWDYIFNGLKKFKNFRNE